MTTKAFLGALLASAAFLGAAHATTTSYTDAAAFALASGPLSSEDFSGYATGTSLLGTVDFGAFTTSSTAGFGSPYNVIENPGINPNGMTGNNMQIGLLSGQSFTITFATAITAFGAIFGNVNDDAARSSFSGGGTTDWLAVISGNSGRFFGIVSDTAFTSVTFTGLSSSEGFGIDDMRWASVPTVPVPASGLLLAGGVLAGWVARRRRV